MIGIWSFSFIIVDISVEIIPSLSIALYRFVIASIAYLLIDLYIKIKKRKSTNKNNSIISKEPFLKRDWIYLFIASLSGVSLFFFIQYSSISVLGPSIPALFVCLLAPVIISILALIFFKEKLSKIKIIGLIIATIGGFLLVSGGNIATLTPLSPNFLGYMFALMTPVLWAIYSTVSKKVVRISSANRINKYVCYLGAIELLILVLINNELMVFIQNILNPILFLNSIYLGVGCYVIGYYIWQYSQNKLKSIKVASFLYIQPFLTLLFSALFRRKDVVVIWNIFGGIIVFIAILLINYERIR